MRNQYDRQLERLNEMLLEMGLLCETAIASASKALTERDSVLAKGVIAMDDEIDQKERDVEGLCLKLLLQQQPVARDLRQISSALKMITDLERIGDQAADISEIVVTLPQLPLLEKGGHITKMAEATCRMVTSSIEAYVKQDLEITRAVIASDDTVDELFTKVKDELIAFVAEDPTCGSEALDLLMIAKYFERIGDHATNVAEWVEFAITGSHLKHNDDGQTLQRPSEK